MKEYGFFLAKYYAKTKNNCIFKVCVSSVTFDILPTMHHSSEFAKGLIGTVLSVEDKYGHKIQFIPRKQKCYVKWLHWFVFPSLYNSDNGAP